jgi:tetratricopeptide (TPR) repeat protein
VFHSILHSDPKDAAATRGIGETEFARGNYRSAQRYFENALRLAPADPTTKERLETTNQLLDLDPTMRGLTSNERYQRSLKLVDLTLSEVKDCTTQTPSPDMQTLLDKAAASLAATVTPARQSEVAESNLDIAEQLWQVRKKQDCKTPPDANRPLALVLARLTQ